MWPFVAIASLMLLIAAFFHWRRKLVQHEKVIVRLEEELAAFRESQRELSANVELRQLALLNNMVEGILLLDPKRRIELINPNLERILPTSGELIGKGVLEVIRLPEFSELLDRVDREGSVSGFELEFPGSGTVRVFEINAVSIAAKEAADRSILLVFHDLTRQKRLENTRRDFVANVSHELRTPLSMIKGYVETLLDGAKDDAEVREKFLRTIEKHANRLSLLIEDLLSLSELEHGKAILNRQRVALRQAAAQVLDELSEKAVTRRIELKNLIPDSLHVSVDQARLRQVFVNLIDNAIKYGRTEGAIEVGAKELSQNSVEVSIHNDGAPIPQNAQERIFERFYRVDSARSRDQGGTGLGLAIVKHIVQFHGGEVRVQSAPDKGTTFFFTLRSEAPTTPEPATSH